MNPFSWFSEDDDDQEERTSILHVQENSQYNVSVEAIYGESLVVSEERLLNIWLKEEASASFWRFVDKCGGSLSTNMCLGDTRVVINVEEADDVRVNVDEDKNRFTIIDERGQTTGAAIAGFFVFFSILFGTAFFFILL